MHRLKFLKRIIEVFMCSVVKMDPVIENQRKGHYSLSIVNVKLFFSLSVLYSFKVLRTQLPKDNPYYNNTKTTVTSQRTARNSLCDVCGLFGDKICSQCKRTRYCSVEHQREDWTYGGHKRSCKTFSLNYNNNNNNNNIHTQTNNNNNNNNMSVSTCQEGHHLSHLEQSNKSKSRSVLFPSLFLEFELVIEEEPPGDPPSLTSVDNITSELNELCLRYQFDWETNQKRFKQISSESEIDYDAEQNIDKVFKNFKKVISKEPEQVLRFIFFSTALNFYCCDCNCN
jgi:hypothetical protein